MSEPIIELQNISRLYGSEKATTAALDNVSFSIPSGQFVSIIGPSGSGKSTLLHIIGLLDTPSGGTYVLRGVDTATISEEEKAATRNTSIGFIFQTFHLLPRTSVLDNVMLPLQYTTLSRREQIDRARAALQQVQLEHRLNHTPAQLSGGEKQRTVIARALVNHPQIILADEPTGNLDSKTGRIIMEIINNLHEAGLTIIVITHETPTAQYTERVISIHDGHIISDVQQAHQHVAYQK